MIAQNEKKGNSCHMLQAVIQVKREYSGRIFKSVWKPTLEIWYQCHLPSTSMSPTSIDMKLFGLYFVISSQIYQKWTQSFLKVSSEEKILQSSASVTSTSFNVHCSSIRFVNDNINYYFQVKTQALSQGLRIPQWLKALILVLAVLVNVLLKHFDSFPSQSFRDTSILTFVMSSIYIW